jgi:putative SOS response-associated peptidase YedK
MCYSGQSVTKHQIDYARQRGDFDEVARLERRYYDNDLGNPNWDFQMNWYADGFSHPKLLCYTNQEPLKPQALIWGLIPGWTKTFADGKKFWNNTLNARGETIFEKPSFKNSAKNKRCLVYLDAFYEHHHFGKGTIPFRMQAKDSSPLPIAGIWEEWVDKTTGEILKTVSIVTTEGNAMMSKIHNNAAAEMGPRMPVILPKEKQDEWLVDCKTEVDQKYVQSQVKPIDTDYLTAYTVGKLKGKDAVGNRPEVIEKVEYEGFELTW